jgi:hypothetical protein
VSNLFASHVFVRMRLLLTLPRAVLPCRARRS